jgi:hypothetical protein
MVPDFRGRIRMHRHFALAVSLTALAGCNKGPDIHATNASVGEVAEQVRAAAGGSLVEPGKWETKVTLLDVDMPGMPRQFAERMKQSMAKMQEHSYSSCLTEADVKRPKEDFFAGKNNNCRYDHFTMSNGTIDAVMRCSGKSSESMTMTMKGTYSPTSYEATTAMNVSGPGGQGMKMKSHSESHRVGECTGDELNTKANAGK